MPSILIIDDEKQICETFSDLFCNEGYRVHIALDGDQGIRIARAHHPDIILSDIRMPGINGHEAVKAFRQIPGLAATPIILITGNADLEDMRIGMAAGADDYLAKPIKLTELIDTVGRHLERSRTRRDAAREELIAERRHTGTLLPGNLVDPLHEIIGCASVLEGDANIMSPTHIAEFARDIINGAETLNQRFENFLIYSRLRGGSLSPTPPALTAIHELLTGAARQIARRHHRLETLRFDVAEVSAGISSDLLVKAVSEVIDNACRYSLSGEPIDISLTADDSNFTIKIADFGMGLSESQVAALASDNQSDGYGLRLSRELTALLGGEWTLDNQPKRGCAVSFKFPIT